MNKLLPPNEIHLIDDECFNDLFFVKKYVSEYNDDKYLPTILKYIDSNIVSSPDFYTIRLNIESELIRYDSLYGRKGLEYQNSIGVNIPNNGLDIEEFPDRDGFNIADYPDYYRYLPYELRLKHTDYCKSFEDLPWRLRRDKDFLIDNIRRFSNVSVYNDGYLISEDVLCKDICIELVKNNPFNYEYIGEYKKDTDICDEYLKFKDSDIRIVEGDFIEIMKKSPKYALRFIQFDVVDIEDVKDLEIDLNEANTVSLDTVIKVAKYRPEIFDYLEYINTDGSYVEDIKNYLRSVKDISKINKEITKYITYDMIHIYDSFEGIIDYFNEDVKMKIILSKKKSARK